MPRKIQLVKQRELALSDTPDIVRFEKNLLSIGFFSAAQATKNGDAPVTRRIEQWVNRGAKRVKVAAEFRGSALGLPRTPDRDKFLAFMQIVVEKKMKTGPLQNPILFPGSRMLKLLGLTDAGRNYEEISIWGKRMADTTITSEQVVYFAAKRKFEDDTLHVFRRFTVTGSGDEKHTTQTGVWYSVVVEDWLLDNINEAYYVPEDFNLYKKLKRPISKGIYNYLNLWFNASGGEVFYKDYADVCSLLDIACHRTESKIREQLSPSMEDLMTINYLKSWTVVPMSSKEGWKLVLEPGESLMSFIKDHQKKRLPGSAAGTRQLLSNEQETVRMKLVNLGIDESKAYALSKEHDPEVVTVQIEYAEHQVRNAPTRFKNIPGFIISFIEGEKPVPKNFETSAQRNRRAELNEVRRRQTEAKQEADRRELILDMKYRTYRKQCAIEHLEREYPGALIETKLKEHAKTIRKDARVSQALDKMNNEQRREVIMQALTTVVASELPLLPFDEWLETQDQQDLEFDLIAVA